ncbi:hypothetical protein [Burkholderia ubonensis]|uniref:hypothetical protein n=1 Tax=Burkholderia ubonensis TaxID=101571 RepID=UPI0012F72020|nr:hypothetical protein [Burkholderia ubonensis]
MNHVEGQEFQCTRDTIRGKVLSGKSMMGKSYRFLADPADEEAATVLAWFRQLHESPREVAAKHHVVLYFAGLGPLRYGQDGTVDADESPIVTVVPPRTACESLWTVGEVHFRTNALSRRYPALYRVSKAFEEWLNRHECVYSIADRNNPYGYYLEGSVQNHDAPIFALPSGLDALKSGRYFVGAQDNDALLDKVCRKLRLRGVRCGTNGAENPSR